LVTTFITFLGRREGGLPCASLEEVVQADAVHRQVGFECRHEAPQDIENVLAGIAAHSEIEDLDPEIGR
jgi:hypothetical protein